MTTVIMNNSPINTQPVPTQATPAMPLPSPSAGEAGSTPSGEEGTRVETPPAWLAALQQGSSTTSTPGTQLAHDAYDVSAWNTTREAYPRLKQAVTAARQHCTSAPALLQDLFWSFYKAAPAFSSTAPSPLDRLHRNLLSEVFQTREWEELRATGTDGDALMSAMGAIALTEQLLASLDDATKERLSTLHEAEQEMRQLLQQAQALQEATLEVDLAQAEQLAALAEQRMRDAHALAKLTAPLLSQVQAATQAQAGALRHAARQALRETLQTQGALQQTMQTLGGLASDGTLAGSQVPLKEKLNLAGRLQQSQKLQQIALLCGQMQAFAHAVQQTKVEETPEEIDGVTLGRDLSQLLPSELALWDDPETEALFLKGFVEGRLWQYDRHCTRLEGQGPIIVALDSSGSMEGTLDGETKEVWSKAVALSLLSIARQQQRDIAVLHFSSRVTRYQFARGQATLEELTSCAKHFDRGGTNFEAWMREALHLVDTATFDRADVICISDGLTDISDELEEEWNRRRTERGMRVFGILLEEDAEDAEEQETGADIFARLSDVWLPLTTLADQAAIAEVFAI
jgi:uncharacterized protein with von Willebrand factor type A (vWA) domain